MTPRRRSAAVSERSLFSAPRSLNEAVNCRFSNLRNTSAPVRRDRVRLCRQGVCSIAPEMRRAAALTSASVTRGPWVRWSMGPSLQEADLGALAFPALGVGGRGARRAGDDAGAFVGRLPAEVLHLADHRRLAFARR